MLAGRVQQAQQVAGVLVGVERGTVVAVLGEQRFAVARALLRSPQPLAHLLHQLPGPVLLQDERARAHGVRMQLNRPIRELADHQVGEAPRPPVQRTGRGNHHPAMVTGGLRWYLVSVVGHG
jgi:hypothetical protein